MSAPEPQIIIQTVRDPEGTGADFAYTIGLTTHGLPELHLWARPTDGDDPGDDWMLSQRDQYLTLREFADLLLSGALSVGDEIVRVVDHGQTELRFRLDEPTDSEDVDAFGAGPGAQVIPLRWSLHRPEAGRLAPLDESLTARLANEITAIRHSLRGVDCGEWRLPDGPPDFGPDQRFGPLTPWVLANAAMFATATADEFDRFCDNVLTTAHAGAGPDGFLGAIATQARSVGRSFVLDEVDEAADQLVSVWFERIETVPDWKQSHLNLAVGLGLSPISDTELGPEIEHFDSHLRHLLGDAIRGYLAACALCDVLADQIQLRAYGPWAFTSTCRELYAPDSRWHAPDQVLDQLVALVERIDGAGFSRLVIGHERARLDSQCAYGELCIRLLGWAMTGPSALPHGFCGVRLAGAEAIDAATAELIRESLHRGLLTTMTALVSAAVYRERLSNDDLALVVDVFEPLLPGSRDLLLGFDEPTPRSGATAA